TLNRGGFGGRSCSSHLMRASSSACDDMRVLLQGAGREIDANDRASGVVVEQLFLLRLDEKPLDRELTEVEEVPGRVREHRAADYANVASKLGEEGEARDG